MPSPLTKKLFAALNTRSGFRVYMVPSTILFFAVELAVAVPAGALLFIHFTSVFFSATVSERSLAKCTYWLFAFHGGIYPDWTTSLMNEARFFTSSYSNKENGAD